MPISIIGFALVGPRKIVQIITQAAALAEDSLNSKYKSVVKGRKRLHQQPCRALETCDHTYSKGYYT